MEYYDDKLCISMRELVDGGVMTQSNYNALNYRGKIEIARRGGGSKDDYALVVVASLPQRFKTKVRKLYPEPEMEVLMAWLEANYEVDQKAVSYFYNWKATLESHHVTEEHVREYIVNASVLNACIRLYQNAQAIHKTMGEQYNWKKMAAAVEGYRVKFGHTLPTSMVRFRKKVREYEREGYACLISGKIGNQSARQMHKTEEQMILRIAAMPNKPMNTTVHALYEAWLCGEFEVYDPKTGEIYDPEVEVEWKNGEPWIPSETTVSNYLNRPANQTLLAKAQLAWDDFMHGFRPHVHRHRGMYSLSQITADDRDLTRKLNDTKQRLKVYVMYDAMSGCILGYSMSREKKMPLVIECFRSMFRTLKKNGWGMPAGIEVENHLMSEFKDGLLRHGGLFSHVHFCAPLNSQEKYAEPLNGAFKISVEHKNHVGIGRFYAKRAKYNFQSQKISDEYNDNYEDKSYFSQEELEADFRADVEEWNNREHPSFPGKSRWEVLVENINPNLAALNDAALAYYVGEEVKTSIRRNSTVRVNYEDWWISLDALNKLEPNNKKVTAYYMPQEDGRPESVFIYQNGHYLGETERVETFNRHYAEQTEEDAQKFAEQQRHIARFDSWTKQNAPSAVGILKKEVEAEEKIEVEDLTLPSPDDREMEYISTESGEMSAAERAFADA